MFSKILEKPTVAGVLTMPVFPQKKVQAPATCFSSSRWGQAARGLQNRQCSHASGIQTAPRESQTNIEKPRPAQHPQQLGRQPTWRLLFIHEPPASTLCRLRVNASNVSWGRLKNTSSLENLLSFALQSEKRAPGNKSLSREVYKVLKFPLGKIGELVGTLGLKEGVQ